MQQLLRFALDGDTDDAVALRAIIAALDRAGFSVTSKVAVGPDADAPWAQLLGIAKISRAESEARAPTALLAADTAPIDAEVVDAEPEHSSTPSSEPSTPDAHNRPPPWQGEHHTPRRPSAELVGWEQAVAGQARATRMQPRPPRRVRSRRL
ncbi:hypothetical protein DQP58_16245 [Mycobacterium colombiense]|uniref:Uncharacterized protein n=1 Tax=Mycobacterium colombiense TaxID=339268 RepID=A0A329KFF0_9MYCO|nr:hypothetical protein [Mycobacterium colombiense]RAU93502.1 hypothetical protein DQP58_16245 [Mycobacterium colombiense]